MDMCAPSSGPDGAPLGAFWALLLAALSPALPLSRSPHRPFTPSPPLSLECQILPPHVLVVLQFGNRPGKAHVPFLQDVGAVTQRRGKFRILLAQEDR